MRRVNSSLCKSLTPDAALGNRLKTGHTPERLTDANWVELAAACLVIRTVGYAMSLDKVRVVATAEADPRLRRC